MKELRLLIVTSGLNNGGKERQTLEAIKALRSTTIKTSLLVLNKNQFYSEYAKTISESFHEVNRGILKLRPLFRALKILLFLKPDIVHSWDTLSSFYTLPLCKMLHIKFVEGSIRDCGIDQGLELKYKKFFLKRSDLIIANSKMGLKIHGVSGEVIYNSIDPSNFKIENSINSEFNIIMVGNFHGYKDHKTFISASYILLKEKIIDFAYLIGDGPKKNAFISYINHEMPEFAGRFIFTGTVRNIEDYLGKCKVGVLCSTSKHQEGLSNAILEYMAAGLVSIATDLGGTAEIINHQYNGFLIQPGDSQSIVNYVTAIKSNQKLSNKINIGAQETLKEKFSKKNYSTFLPSLYNRLLEDYE
jgi:glycosyltransferase involved in cell wall biosynthesis